MYRTLNQHRLKIQVSVGESQTLTNQQNTQNALGTKPISSCRFDGSNFWQGIVMQGGNTSAQVVWDSSIRATTPMYPGAINVTQINGTDGYVYTKGPRGNNTDGLIKWQVCRNG